MPTATETPFAQQRRLVPEDTRQSDREVTRRPGAGPLLAVCGLVGGAGVTTLTYLVALAAARQQGGPILVADTGGPSGGLAALAGVEAPRSLPELASHLAVGLPLKNGIYAAGVAGLRVLAAAPDFGANSTIAPVSRILEDAREVHRLTVVDCGTLGRDVDRIAAAAATHLAWVFPATERDVERGEHVLRTAPRMAVRELLVARRDADQPKAPLKRLRRLAAERRAPLVLVPQVSGIQCGSADRVLEEAQVAIQAILGATLR